MRWLLLCSLTALSACSTVVWRPGPSAQFANWEQQRAQCLLVAKQTTGFRGYGLAGGLEEGLANAENFTHCMVAAGWVAETVKQ